MRLEEVLRRPVALTEKANFLRQKGNQLVFEVAREANKTEIKDAVEHMFAVKVSSVNTMNYRGKDRRMGRGYSKLHNWKKAIVTLKEGDVDFFADAAVDAATKKTD
jgi:large subunit ribosomal protein L23